MPLYGLEEKNHNAYARGIYCHGTNNPQELGYATSQGCIRISNADAIQLADYIKAKTAKKQQVFLGVIE
jgi:lipoprotein-anchoring transpeptidase ErfK/SrfK